MSINSNPPSFVDVSLAPLANAPLVPIKDELAWRVVGPERPLCASSDCFVSADARFRVGVARYDRVTLDLHDWTADVFMYIFEGQVEVSDHAGRSRIYGPGDAFVLPKGFKGIWKELSDVKKIHIVYE